MNIFNSNKLGYFIFGGLLLIFSFIQLFRKQQWVRYISILLILGIIVSFIYHLTGMGLRWYISGYAPWSNSYETMVYVAWAQFWRVLYLEGKVQLHCTCHIIWGSNSFRFESQLDGSSN